MLRLLSTLVRGAAAEAEDAVFSANAIRVLEQQLREAAASLEHARKELACAMAHQSAETRSADALAKRVGELDLAIREALAADRADLAGEAAAALGAAEDEAGDRRHAIQRFDADIARLRRMVEDGRQRLLELRRGLETARAGDALRRAGANGRKAAALGSGSLREAEATLARIRQEQAREEDAAAALDLLDRSLDGRALDEKLADAGIGAGKRTKAADVLSRYGRTDV
jgi:phage shock protein A